MKDSIWCGLVSGKIIDLTNIRPEDIEIRDIAWSLASMVRFNGHLPNHISIAQHSIYVSELVPDHLKLAALLHDAHEAYLGDVVRPIKDYFKECGMDLELLENRWQQRIWERFKCVPKNAEDIKSIEEADDLQLAREIASFAHIGPFQNVGLAALDNWHPLKFVQLVPQEVDPLRDYKNFLIRFQELFNVDEKPVLV